MRRMCLDTESNYFWRSEWAWATPDAARNMLKTKADFRFDCAVVYDSAHRKYYEYGDRSLPGLIKRLYSAEEIVTVNGSGCDLPVLERVCGRQAIKPLWKIHRDLLGWGQCHGLAELSRKLLLPNLWAEFETRRRKHFERLRAKGAGEFLANKIAKCRTDVEYTVKVTRMIPANDQWRNKDERG